MSLNPTSPPGRTNRKARAFTADIGRLHAEGYTCESIRRALIEVGVHVSTTTVRREIARWAEQRHPERLRPAMVADETAPPSSPQSRVEASAPSFNRLHGRDVAETFLKSHITNSLIRKGEQR